MSGKGKTHKLPKSKKPIVNLTQNLVRPGNVANALTAAMTKLNIKEKESNAFGNFGNIFAELGEIENKIPEEELKEQEKKRKQMINATKKALQSTKVKRVSSRGRLVEKPPVYGKGYLRRKTIKNNKRK
jgi:hypothetical protein